MKFEQNMAKEVVKDVVGETKRTRIQNFLIAGLWNRKIWRRYLPVPAFFLITVLVSVPIPGHKKLIAIKRERNVRLPEVANYF